MTPITEEGRQQMAEAEAVREARREDQRAAGVTALLAGEVEIGSAVFWQKVEGGPIGSGLVVDDLDGELVVLDASMDAHKLIVTVKDRGSRHQTGRLLVAIVRVRYADVTAVEPRTGRALTEYARAAFAMAGIRSGEWGPADDDFVGYGRVLLDLARKGRAA